MNTERKELPVQIIALVNNGNVCQCMNPGRSKYIRQVDGPKVYPFCKQQFKKLATEAKAVLEIGGMVLIDTEVLDQYLDDTFKMAI